MADNRTTVTELVTGLGATGLSSLDDALGARPREMVSVSPELWDTLGQLRVGGLHTEQFEGAWDNGQAFFLAQDGLRRRRPLVIEWRGGARQPGDEPVPADLRIDHVYLVSCKYRSKILINPSPFALFERLLSGGHGGRSSGDWYVHIAPQAYRRLYHAAVRHTGLAELPDDPGELTRQDRVRIKDAVGPRQWPTELLPMAQDFALEAAEASAQRWRRALADEDGERVLWRLLRIGSTPYFVLGAGRRDSSPLRVRVATAWDWRQHYQLKRFRVAAAADRDQPVVDWTAEVTGRRSGVTHLVEGHVEIRWSHGKFAQPPEAKVYLDTPHEKVPGYWPLQ